jgi:hypothetical protein
MGSILLSWTDNSTVETGYRIERRNAGASAWQTIGTTGAGAIQFSDVNVTGTQAYDYRIITLNGAETSAPSAIVSATAADNAVYRAWKLEKLGDADAPDDGDGDGDGLSNLQEYLFDLDPVEPDRYEWQASAPADGSGAVTITFPSSAGRSYRVEFSHDLALWSPGSPIIPGDGLVKQWTDDGTFTGGLPDPDGKRFYRIAVTAP